MVRAGRLIGKLNMSANAVTPQELARAAWPSAVGRKIAAHTSAVSLVRGCLIVEVEDAVWQRQLTTLERQILPKLQELAGAEVVTSIAFRPMVPRRAPQRAESARAEFGLLADDAEGIADPILRRVYLVSKKKASA